MKSLKEQNKEKEVFHTIKIKIGRDKWTEFRIKVMRDKKTLKEVFYTFVNSASEVKVDKSKK